MKNIIKVTKATILLGLLGFLLIQCSKEDNVKYERPASAKESTHPNDVFLKEKMLKPYGTSVRWRWNNRFIKPSQKAVPVASKYVIPVTKLVNYLWIGAYESQGAKGKEFIKKLFPTELQYIGSYIYEDGSILLGYAEGGARITLLNLNSYDLTSRDWLTNPGGGILATVHHEFSHLVHQNHGLPAGFNKISEKYLGNGWKNDVSLDDAIGMGMVRNYGTLNEFEDFCEVVSHFLTLPKATFEERFINQKNCSSLTSANAIAKCQKLNKGRKKIAQKLDLIIKFYKSKFGFDLVAVRDALENRINYVVTNNKIPE